jgi:hypothetical protein
MNTCTARSLVIVSVFLATVATRSSKFDRIAVAADTEHEHVEFDRIDIPASLPHLWPKEVKNFVHEPHDKFVSMIEQINARDRGPRLSSLKSAHYEAKLVDDTLRNGLLTASVKRIGRGSSRLELGRFSFALNELKWQGHPAVWGTAPDGRTWVQTYEGHDELLGEWSCRGRKIPGGIDFDLHLPPATTSLLDLHVPRALSIYAPTAEVTLLSENPMEQTKLWRIHCGGDRHCRLTFLAREGIEPSRQSLLVEHDMDVFVREEDLRFQLNLHLEALDAPIQELTLKVPADLKIYSAIYGADTPVPIHRTPEFDVDGRLTISLPGLLKGLRRTLHITGSAAQKPGQETILPQIIVENSTFDGGTLVVAVQPPLQVRSIRPHGYRQETTNVEQSKFSFRQLMADGQLIMDVHRAPIVLSGQLLSVLSVEDEVWNLMSEIRWKSLTGGGYQTSCVFPPDWEITDVRLKSELEKPTGQGTFGDSAKINWDVKLQPGGRSELSIEFLKSIQPNQTRTVVVTAQRKMPQSGQFVPVPLPQLLNCDIEKVTFGLEIPSSMTSVFSPNSRLERDSRPDPTQFTIPSERPEYHRRWYRCDSPDDAGTLQLVPRLQPVQVTTETLIEAVPTEYRLKYSIQSKQNDTQADRLLVYLTESSPEVRWVWKNPQPIELRALLLPKSRHIEWNLPSKGELWEISIPRTTGQGIAIEGTATNRWPINQKPALLFVPQAVEKLAKVKLSNPDNLELMFGADGMKPTEEPLSWVFSVPQASFNLAISHPEPSREFPLMVSMQLQTRMSADADGSDLYRVLLQLENGSSQDTLRVKLDPSAVLQDVFVSDEPIKVTPQSGEFLIPGLNAAGREKVELIYRVPASANVIFENRRIVVPQVNAQVLAFFWKFSLPPSTRFFDTPTGVSLLRSPNPPTLYERFFGPLGRSANEALFQPQSWESWRQLFQPRQVAAPLASVSDDEFVASIEWQAVAPDLPKEIWIELWHSERIQLLAWISLGLCLLAGIVLRIRGWAVRDRAAAYGLGLSLAAAFSVSQPYASFFGGATAGMLIALLLPRPLLKQPNLVGEHPEDRTQDPHRAILAFLLGGITAYGIFSQFEGLVSAQDATPDDSTPHKRPIVYVPVDKDGQPSDILPWVYVSRDVIEHWKAIAIDVGTDPGYLISSARYEIRASSDGNLNLSAKFRVHVLDTSDVPVTVALALGDISLPDANSCLVNGVPHPINILPNGKGYSIELSRNDHSQTTPTPNPETAERRENEYATYEIHLFARKPRPQLSSFDLRVPLVANSHLEFSQTESVPFIEIVGGLGFTDRSDKSQSVIGELGPTAGIQVRWGQSVPPKRPPQVTASMLQHLDLHSGYSELFFHIEAGIADGSLDVLEFSLPKNAVIRKLHSHNDDINPRNEIILQSDVIDMPDGERRWRLLFDRPYRSPIVLDGTILLTQANSLSPTPLPKFGIARSEWYQFQYARNWWGVSTSADFRLEQSNLDPESVNTILPATYLSAWSSAAKTSQHESLPRHQPQKTFELREESIPMFTLIPHQTHRQAKQWTQVGLVGRNRLIWIAEGEIETTHSSTFQTTLLVDRRLRIEDISIKADDAERKTRWSESREHSRVVVFLSDQAQGKQTIRLRGSLPLVAGTPIQLPSVRIEDCDMGTTQLELFHDPEVDVELTSPPEWKADASEIFNFNISRFQAGAVKRLGKFQLNDFLAHGSIQTSSRHSRCTSRGAVLLTRSDARTWQMKYRLEMTPDGQSPVRMGLTFPSAFKDLSAVTVTNAELDWREPDDGLRQLDLILNRNDPVGTVVLQFEMTLDEPKQPDWELPLPTPLYSNGDETLLVIDRHEASRFPKSGREIPVADLPEWSTRFYEHISQDGLAFSVPFATIQLQRDIAKTDLRPPSIRLLDQRVWIHENGYRSGITQAFLSSLRDDLEFDLPVGLHVTSLFLDDHPLALTGPADGKLTIPVVDIGSESLLTITWSVDESDQAKSISEPFLWPRKTRVEKNLIAFSPNSETRLMCREGLTAMSSLDQALDRLDTMLDRHALLRNDTREILENRWALDQLYARVKNQLTSEIRHPDEQSTRRMFRWNRIVKRLNQLEAATTPPPTNWSNQLLDEPQDAGDFALRGSITGEKMIQIRQIDQRFVRSAFMVILPLILVPFFRRTIRIEWSAWLHRHVAFSWFLLATVWWVFLTPSVFGTVILIVAIARAFTQYKPLKTTV